KILPYCFFILAGINQRKKLERRMTGTHLPAILQAADKARGAGESSIAQSFALPRRSRSWFRCPASGRFALRAIRHALPFGAPKPYAQHFFTSVPSARWTQKTRLSPK